MLITRRIPIVAMLAVLLADIAAGELTIYDEEVLEVLPCGLTVAPSEITMEVGMPGRLRTVYCERRGLTAEPGTVAVASLRGSTLPKTIVLTTVPGTPFAIPALSAEGEYSLEDIRIEVAGFTQVRAVPDRVTIKVKSRRSSGIRAGSVDGTVEPEQ